MAATLPSHSLTIKIMDNAFENEYKMTSDTGNEKKELRESLDFIDQNCHSEKSSASAAARAVLQKIRSVSKSSALFTAPSSFLLLLSEKAVPPKDQRTYNKNE